MSTPMTTDRQTRAWWHLHLLTIIASTLLIASLATLNLPLETWADATTLPEPDGWGGSGEQVGWPQPCYRVEFEYSQSDITQLEAVDFDFATMIFNGFIAVILVLGNAAAFEMLTRKFSRVTRFNVAFMLALMATLATYAGLKSGLPPSWAVFELAALIQELAKLLVFASIFVCWCVFFNVVATKT